MIETQNGENPGSEILSRIGDFLDVLRSRKHHRVTDGFNNIQILGKGRYGSLYKAIWADGQELVIKRIEPSIVLHKAGSNVLHQCTLMSFPSWATTVYEALLREY